VTQRAKHPVVVVGLEVHRRRVQYVRAWIEEDDYLGEPVTPRKSREKPKPSPLFGRPQ
jgi:hypothetical protein